MTLGSQLRQCRQNRDLSMDSLVNEFNRLYGLKTTKSMISRWENDLSTPTNAYLSALVKKDFIKNYEISFLFRLTMTKLIKQPFNSLPKLKISSSMELQEKQLRI